MNFCVFERTELELFPNPTASLLRLPIMDLGSCCLPCLPARAEQGLDLDTVTELQSSFEITEKFLCFLSFCFHYPFFFHLPFFLLLLLCEHSFQFQFCFILFLLLFPVLSFPPVFFNSSGSLRKSFFSFISHIFSFFYFFLLCLLIFFPWGIIFTLFSVYSLYIIL